MLDVYIVLQILQMEANMQSNESTRQWQVTCVCGWRTLGTKDEVVSAVITHGQETHGQEVTEEQAFSQAVPATQG